MIVCYINARNLCNSKPTSVDEVGAARAENQLVEALTGTAADAGLNPISGSGQVLTNRKSFLVYI